MKLFSKHGLKLSLILTLLVLNSCLAGSAGDSDSQTGSRIVNTIPAATLTAIGSSAEASQTPVPDPLGIPLEDLDGTELEFWYIWDLDEPGAGMNAIAERFNQENEWGITVNPVDQGLVLDPIASVETAFADGVVPHLMLSNSMVIANWYDDGLLIDLTALIEDPAVGLSDNDLRAFYPGIYETLRLPEGQRPGLPFAQSIQAIFYNQSWASELGYHRKPLDRDDFFSQSCARVGDNQQARVIFSPQAENILSFIYAYQGSLFDEGLEDYNFDSVEIRKVAGDWQDLYQDGCGSLIANYPNPMAIEMEFESFNSREALMIMAPAQMMNHVHTGPNQTGRADQWTLLPFLGPEGEKAVASQLQTGVIFHTSPEEQLASWLFLKYLINPEVQAEWVQYSHFYPSRNDSLRHLRDFREENPAWAEGLSLLKYAQAAPLDPSWSIVQLALEDAFEEILAKPELNTSYQLRVLDRVAAELKERTD